MNNSDDIPPSSDRPDNSFLDTREIVQIIHNFDKALGWREGSIENICSFVWWGQTDRVIQNTKSATVALIMMHRELLELRNHEFQLNSEAQRLREESDIFNKYECVLEVDLNGDIFFVNDFVLEKTWYSREELIGEKKTNMRIMSSKIHSKAFWRTFWMTILDGRVWAGDVCNRKKDGSYYWLWTLVIPIKDEYGIVKSFKVIRQDVSEWYALKEKLRNTREKRIDPLTSLPNRTKCFEDFTDDKSRSAIIIHVNRMYDINNAYGKTAGDKIIQRIGKMLEEYSINYSDKYHVCVYKFDGTDFCLIYKNPVDESHIREQVSLIQNLTVRVDQDDIFHRWDRDPENSPASVRIPVSFSVWATLNISNIDILLNNAYSALKIARETQQNYMLFGEKDYDQNKSKIYFDMLTLSREALKWRDILRIYIQEIIKNTSWRDGEGLGPRKFEALIRMKDPITWKIHSPEDFLSIIESDGKNQELTSYVIREVCEFMMNNDFHISINLTGDDLLSVRRGHTIYEEIRKYNIDPHRITFEILESIELLDVNALSNIAILQGYGFSISIDDYWIAYSSIARIPSIKPNYLKIDISITRWIDIDDDKRVMVKSIIVLAHGLWMKIIAEGVETKEEQLILKVLWVDYSQGYFFSRPEDIREKTF